MGATSINSIESAVTEREAVEKGLLVLAKQRHLVDPLHLPSTSSTIQTSGSQAGSKSKARGVKGGGEATGSCRGMGSNLSGTFSGKGKRVRNEQEEELLIDEDDEDMEQEEESSSQPPKRVKRNSGKGWKKELENDAILDGLEDDEFGWTNEGDGVGFVKEIDEGRRSQDEEMLFDEREEEEEEEVLEM